MESKANCFNRAKRVMKEYAQIKKNPDPYFRAEPLVGNILEWHFVIFGLTDTPYEGGIYHGRLVFPQDYPFEPPEVYMITPNGRFETEKNLCLSLQNNYRLWNPMWNISSILVLLQCSMTEDTKSFDSIIETSDTTKRKFARDSLKTAWVDQRFRTLFPDLAALSMLHISHTHYFQAIRKTARGRKDPKPRTNPASTGKSDNCFTSL